MGWGDEKLVEGMSVVDACIRLTTIWKPTWWALENPVGRISRYLPDEPLLKFDPWQYGDPWTKRTLLWGRFLPPRKRPVEPLYAGVGAGGGRGRKPALPMPDRGPLRAIMRAATPPGFAAAFFEANP